MSIRSSLLNGPLGFGAAPLGNMFRNIPEEEALATVESAWQQGVRYFDTYRKTQGRWRFADQFRGQHTGDEQFGPMVIEVDGRAIGIG